MYTSINTFLFGGVFGVSFAKIIFFIPRVLVLSIKFLFHSISGFIYICNKGARFFPFRLHYRYWQFMFIVAIYVNNCLWLLILIFLVGYDVPLFQQYLRCLHLQQNLILLSLYFYLAKPHKIQSLDKICFEDHICKDNILLFPQSSRD